MKLYFLYLFRYSQKNIKNCLFIFSTIIVSIIMMTIITVYLDSMQNSLSIASPKLVGEHHVAFMNISDSKVDYLVSDEKVVSLQKVPYFKVGGSISGVKYAASVDDTLKYWKHDLIEGSLPKEGEVLLPTSANIDHSESPQIGDTVNISLTSNKKTFQMKYKISGFIRPYVFYSEYIYLNETSFYTLLTDNPELSLNNNVYLTSINYDKAFALVNEFYTKFGNLSSVVINMPAFEKPDQIDPLIIRIYVLTILVSMIICGVCLYTVISLNLNESRPNLGLLRVLGAKNLQIIILILIQLLILILIALPIGILIGSTLVRYMIHIFSIFNDNQTVYTYAFTIFSKTLIPLTSILIILITGIPVIVRILKNTPLQLIVKANRKIPHFLYYEAKKTYSYKHPLLWYAKTQIIRNKGKTFYLCITTAICMSLFIFLTIVLSFDLKKAEQKINSSEFTLEAIVDDRGTLFTLKELIELEQIKGVKYINIDVSTELQINLNESQSNYLPNSKLTSNNQYSTLVHLSAFDSHDQYRFKEYLIAGSLSKCTQNSNLIILLDKEWTKDGSKHFRLGDKIYCDNGKFTLEYEIGAIVKGVPSNDLDLQFYLPIDEYNRIGRGLNVSKVSIYCYPDLISNVRKTLSELQGSNFKLNDNSKEIEKQFEQAYANIKFSSIICTLILLLCIIMLLCFYTFYYRSRSHEFAELNAFGASSKMITKIILYEAFIQILLSSFVSIFIGYMLSYLTYRNVSRYPNNFAWETPWLSMLITFISIFFIGMISITNSIRYINMVNITHIES